MYICIYIYIYIYIERERERGPGGVKLLRAMYRSRDRWDAHTRIGKGTKLCTYIHVYTPMYLCTMFMHVCLYIERDMRWLYETFYAQSINVGIAGTFHTRIGEGIYRC